MKILTVIGARPQFIKASVVSKAISRVRGLTEIIVHTGQHFDYNMADIFFGELEMNRPHYALGIHGGGHASMTGRMLVDIETVLLTENPGLVMVYGDTNSTLAGALAAAKMNIPLAHVEAGLRSFNWRMPEEVNRVLTDHAARILFAPTEIAVKHLAAEGITGSRVINSGDVMYDAMLFFRSKAHTESRILQRLGLRMEGYVLATVHRQENADDDWRLRCIFEGLSEAGWPIVIPMHPRTRKMLAAGGLALGTNVRIIDPIGFLDMLCLEQNAALIATDSGGVQKEAFFHRIPCVTLRDETEWVELVELGWNVLVPPTDPGRIANAIRERIGTQGLEAAPFGHGDAAEIIVKYLSSLD